ncbi:MAG: hypothetical protein J0I41_07450 [Filimonas sp.]|nr:hypothetical protein [Filimonas sp.]
MKSILTVLFLGITIAHAQKNEVWVNANSGLFHFAGDGATSTTAMMYALDNSMAYAQPYGKKNGVGYGLSLSAQRVTKYNLIYGVEGGYEQFSSKASITSGLYTSSLATSYLMQTTATGKSTSTFGFINFHPYIGYRIRCNKVNVDITGGLDIAIATKANQVIKGEATQSVLFKQSLQKPKTDIRPRVQVTASYHKVGIYAGYSFGQRNFEPLYMTMGKQPEALARIFRFGISYRIL